MTDKAANLKELLAALRTPLDEVVADRRKGAPRVEPDEAIASELQERYGLDQDEADDWSRGFQVASASTWIEAGWSPAAAQVGVLFGSPMQAERALKTRALSKQDLEVWTLYVRITFPASEDDWIQRGALARKAIQAARELFGVTDE